MDRRRFLKWTVKSSALLGVLGAVPARARGQEAGEGTAVLEYFLAKRKESDAYLPADADHVIDHSARWLGGPDSFALDVISSMFPETSTVGIKVDGRVSGRATPTLVASLAGRVVAADVPAERVIVWDRTAERLEKLGLGGSRAGAYRSMTVEGAGGWGRTLQPSGGEVAGMTLARLAETVTWHATISSLAARDDGRMAPFVIESLAGAVRVGEEGAAPAGVQAARAVSDAALMPRAVFHIADLFAVPLGRDKAGNRQVWDARTVLISPDAVALTRVAHRILASARAARGLGPTPEPPALAEAVRLGLGEGSLDALDWRKLTY